MKLGDFSETRRQYDAALLADYAVLTGTDPVNMTAVPEPLIAALFSYLLGVKLPGPGTNYLKQDMVFLAAAPLDQELTARVEITRLRNDGQLVDLWASCRDAQGRLICEGRSLVLAKDVGA